jgi:hypothetical protein
MPLPGDPATPLRPEHVADCGTLGAVPDAEPAPSVPGPRGRRDDAAPDSEQNEEPLAKPSRRARDRMRAAEIAGSTSQTGSRSSDRGIPGKGVRGRRQSYRQRSFLDRFGGAILIGFAAIGIAVLGFVFLQPSSGQAYACDSLLTPGPTDPIPTATPGPTTQPSPSPTPTPAPSVTLAPGQTATPAPSPTATSSPTPSPVPTPSPAPTATLAPGQTPAATPTLAPTPTPAPSPTAVPGPTQRLGFVVSDLGRNHILDQTQKVEYDYCPPGSGPHWNIARVAPVPRGFYQPDQTVQPEQWIHNLEHGAVVVLYSCGSDGKSCPSADELAVLRRVFDETQPTPQAIACQLPNKVVVARFDTMTTRFALVAWDRELLSNTADVDQFKIFAQQFQDGPATPESGVCFGTS